MRIALEHGHVSVADMAETLGCDRNTVGNYLSGRTTPRLPTLRVWAMRCGVPLDWIRYGTGPATDDDGNGGGSRRTTRDIGGYRHRVHPIPLPRRIAA